MTKLIILAAIMAVAVAKPGAIIPAPIAYSGAAAYGAPYAAYNGYYSYPYDTAAYGYNGYNAYNYGSYASEYKAPFAYSPYAYAGPIAYPSYYK